MTDLQEGGVYEPVENDHRDVKLYKKYFKSRSAEGFLTIKPWFENLKLSIDIGDVNNGVLRSSTLAWVNAIDLAVYLRAVANYTASDLYPANERNGLPTPEAFIAYGGGMTADRQVVGRVVKIHQWTNGDTPDPSAFAWKAGRFEGRRAGKGAVIPDMTKPISQNLIKITRVEMLEISYRIDLGLSSYGASHPEELWEDVKR